MLRGVVGPPVSRETVSVSAALPRRLDRYDILGRVAAGGMAEILLARVVGPHAFERLVAMKRILPHLVQDRTFVQMFVDEARIAASIHHARVVQVHELACIGGEYFLVMEYVEGESLGGLMRRLWLRREPLDRVLAAHIIAEACAGLHAAHELTDTSGVARQVVHRDVSPQNVMVTYSGEVKVLDFGIAKASDSARTQGGQVKGKCEYMSPEQCRGEPLDRGSDIFSLGVLLYELTVGRRLFKRENCLLAFYAICHEPIPAPSQIDPSYPPVLEAICARALAHERRDRYPSMLEMRRDLVAAIRGMAGTERRASEEEALAGLMTRLFEDRMREKREMMGWARSGSSVDRIPVAEVDAQVELPDVPRLPGVAALLQGTGSVAAAPAPVRRRRLATGVAVIALVAAAVGGGAWLLRGGAPTPVAPQAPAEPVAKALAPPAAEAPPPQPPAMVVVESVPPGAEVRVDGEVRGTAPCTIAVARGRAALVVEVLRDGFRPVTERVVPDADQKLVIHLQELAAPVAVPPAIEKEPGVRASPPKKKKTPAVFERFQ